MRIAKKLLCGLGGLLAVILLFVLFCHFNPKVTETIGNKLDNNSSPYNGGQVSETLSDDVLFVSTTVTIGNVPLAGTSDADTDGLTIPSNVASLAGYTPVIATGTEITDSKAEQIAKEVSKGNTGSSLSFDESIYPYYGIINDTQKTLYKQIYANANDELNHFAPATDVTSTDLNNAFTAVVNDHPELFWVETSYKFRYTPKEGKVADITLTFNTTADDLVTSKDKFEAAAKLITDETYGYYTDYEKERICHDQLISRVKYDANAPINQSAYSALVYGRTVCSGYARAYQYVLQQLGIPCYYVTGYAGQNHAWNIVKLDDGYYNVDSTWDDTTPATYNYFNRSDSDYATTHIRKGLSIYLPACTGNRYSGLEATPPVTVTDTTTTTTTPSTTTTTTTTTTTDGNSNATTQNSASTTTTEQESSDGGSITVLTVRGGGDKGYIDNVADYFNECFASMIHNDNPNINFELTVTDKALWDKIYKAYDKGECQEGYIDRYLVEKHKNSCRMSVQATPQSDGSYLLKHTAEIN
jgi:transglutaminase-like putative cysteine protease